MAGGVGGVGLSSGEVLLKETRRFGGTLSEAFMEKRMQTNMTESGVVDAAAVPAAQASRRPRPRRRWSRWLPSAACWQSDCS